jgi:hypothetical protein
MQKVKDQDDPNRCQGITANGQCLYYQEKDSKFCIMHGGNKAGEAVEKGKMRNYRLTKFKARAEQLSNSSNVNSLRDEVAILRILIEEKWNSCNDTSDLLLQSGPLSDLTIKCSALVEKCQRLEYKLGNFLDRNKIMQFAQICVEIISSYVEEEDMDAVSDAILKALGEI